MKNSYRTKKTLFANTFNNYFTDVTHSLGLKKKDIELENTLAKIESIKKIIKREYNED